MIYDNRYEYRRIRAQVVSVKVVDVDRCSCYSFFEVFVVAVVGVV